MLDLVFYLGKYAQQLFFPFNLALLSLILSLWLHGRRKPKLAFRLHLLGLILLLLPASGHVVQLLMVPLERSYPIKKSHEYPEASLIVVLGGTTGQLGALRVEAEEMNGARLQMAARLFHAGKAKRIVVSGGPYRMTNNENRAEADDMKDVLIAFGVPASAIIAERESRNTFENALGVSRLLAQEPEKRILLVTSAFHLPRSVGLFSKRDFEVIPVPCSFQTGKNYELIEGCIPDPYNIVRTQAAIKEYLGRFAYWLVGKG